METLLRIGLSNAAGAAALAIVAAAGGLIFRRPAITHALWLLVLLKLLAPPLFTIPLHLPGGTEAPLQPNRQSDSAMDAAAPFEHSTPTIDIGPHPAQELLADAARLSADHPVNDVTTPRAATIHPHDARLRLSTWLAPAALLAWLSGTAICLCVSLGRIAQFRRFALCFAQPAPLALRRQAAGLARRMGMHDCPEIWLVPGVVSPMLWAAGGAARVLVPRHLLNHLDERQRSTLLAHELAHLRRRDHWVRYLELLATSLYWWHPVVWWARRELHEAAEQCCDAWVLWAVPGSFRQYATALLQTIEFLSQPRPSAPLLVSGLGHFRQIKRRFAMLKQGNVSKALTWGGFAGLCGAAALLLPLAPTLAQSPDKPQPTPAQDQVAKTAIATSELAIDDDAEKPDAVSDRDRAEKEEADEDQADPKSDKIQAEIARAQDLAEKAVATAKEQAAKAMDEARQALESAAKEKPDNSGDDADNSRQSREMRSAIQRAQAEAARAVNQARREMAQAIAEAKRAMASAQRQAGEAQREATRWKMQNKSDGDLRRQLEDAHRQIKDLSKQLAEAQKRLGQMGGKYGADSKEFFRSDKLPSKERTSGDSEPQRQQRLEKLEAELQALMGEVKRLEREDQSPHGK